MKDAQDALLGAQEFAGAILALADTEPKLALEGDGAAHAVELLIQ